MSVFAGNSPTQILILMENWGKPLSLNFGSGITRRPMKESVMKGLERLGHRFLRKA